MKGYREATPDPRLGTPPKDAVPWKFRHGDIIRTEYAPTWYAARAQAAAHFGCPPSEVKWID